jgi:hypothetical protein
LTSDSLPRGSYVDDRNNPPIINATYLLFTLFLLHYWTKLLQIWHADST